MTDLETGVIDTWQEKTDKELNQLKKEMIERVIEKMKEKNQTDALLHIWKTMVVDYLLDEWESGDKVNDFFLWMGINLFSSSADKLKDLREKIKNSNTKEELESLEKSIIENLDNFWKDQQSGGSSTPSWVTSWSVASAAYTSQSQTDFFTSSTESTIDSAKVWEAKNVPLKERMARLFPDWVPKTEKEMKKYIKKIKVPIRTPEWKTKKLTLHINKKLAKEYEAIFKEMYDKWIPVNPESTWWFNWRKMRKSNKMSHHSYWTAVDVNFDVNGWVYGKTDKNSPYFNDNETVAIWKRHWFYRWWDRSKNYNDPMHFSYMNA